jgi:hypothetical protein
MTWLVMQEAVTTLSYPNRAYLTYLLAALSSTHLRQNP